MGVRIEDIKRGDWVTIGPLQIEDVGSEGENNFSMYLPYGIGEYWMDVSCIASKVFGPRKLRNGDKAQDSIGCECEILAIAGDYAMVKWSGGNVTATLSSRLTLVEPDQ